MESGFQRSVHRRSGRELFFHTRKDDNVRIYRHANAEDDTCDTRQSQRNVKRI